MAIARNVEAGTTAKLSRAALSRAALIEEGGGEPPTTRTPPPRAAAQPAAQPAQPAAQPAVPLTATFNPALTAAALGQGNFVRPDLVFNPEFVPPRLTLPPPVQTRTTTQIAQGAIAQLRNA